MPETDEQELAKALDSVASLGDDKPSPVANDVANSPHDNGVQPIVPADSPVAPAALADSSSDGGTSVPVSTPTSDPAPVSDAPADDSASSDAPADDTSNDAPDETPVEMPVPTPVEDTTMPAPSTGPLDSIKSAAIGELRPLVDKLDLAPAEKFDTLLMLIRSTDDMQLLGPAHEAAKAIPDETRRAQALLDVIKEIDYLTHQKNQV